MYIRVDLYDLVRPRTNFFQASMKLIEKQREGSRVRKRHDQAQTPYQRLMNSDDIPPEVKQGLEQEFQALNLAALNRAIRKIQQQLNRLLCPVGDRLRKAG